MRTVNWLFFHDLLPAAIVPPLCHDRHTAMRTRRVTHHQDVHQKAGPTCKNKQHMQRQVKPVHQQQQSQRQGNRPGTLRYSVILPKLCKACFCVHRLYDSSFQLPMSTPAAGAASGAAGRASVKTQPLGSLARTESSPSIARANSRAVQRPMPKPPFPDSSTVLAR